MNEQKTQVCVIGGAGVDIFGTSAQPIIPEDSNPGTISFSFGGVGRNIANNLSKLNIAVELICALGNDDNGDKLSENCRTENIGLRHCLRCGLPTASYLCVNDAKGNIYAAVAAMAINEAVTVDFLRTKLEFINSCQLVVIDTNLSQEACDFLLNEVKTAIYVDPVSCAKAVKLKRHLAKIAVIKPNYPEISVLLGEELPLAEAGKQLLATGIKEVYLTLGAAGVLAGSSACQYKLGVYPGAIVNTTGCGDAFLAGVIYGALKNKDLLTKAKYGLAAANICSRSPGAVSELLNERELLRLVGDDQKIGL